MAKLFELTPIPGTQKSFHGRALVKEWDGGQKDLYSCGRCVCSLTVDGAFMRGYAEYSAVLLRHVNAFLALYGVGHMVSRDEWEKMGYYKPVQF